MEYLEEPHPFDFDTAESGKVRSSLSQGIQPPRLNHFGWGHSSVGRASRSQ